MRAGAPHGEVLLDHVGVSLRTVMPRRSMRVRVLLLTFTHAAGGMSLTARGALLVESRALTRRARQHRVKALSARLRITEAGGSSTNVSVP